MNDTAANTYQEGPWLVIAESKPYGEAWITTSTPVRVTQ